MAISHRMVRSLIRQPCSTKMTNSSRALCPFSSQFTIDRPKRYESIPGPEPLPLIGNTWRYLPLIGEYDIEKTPENGEANLKEYGPLVREVLAGSFSILHVFDPVDMQSVFRNEGKYPNRRSHRALLKYRHDRPQFYSSGGMFPENGAPWYRLRKLIQTIMLNQSQNDIFVPVIESTSNLMVANINKLRDVTGSIDDLMPYLYRWALETNGLVFVGKSLGCLDSNGSSEAEELIHSIHETHEAILSTELAAIDLWKYFPTSDYKRLEKSQDTMGKIISKYINNLKTSSKSSDNETVSIASKLFKNSEASTRDIFTIIMDLFLAAFDTTAFVVGFTLYHLSCNQHCQQKVRSELMELLPNKSDPINADTLRNMKYLKACVKESLRINPFSIGTGRLTNQEMTLRGYNIPEGTMIIVQNQVACMQESNFSQPKQFIPERWLQEKKRESSPFTILPFGYGARMCVGRRLSETEIYILLSKLIRSYQIDYNNDEPFRSKTRFINVPVGPLKLRFSDLPN